MEITISLSSLAMKARTQYITEYDDSITELFMQFLNVKIQKIKNTILQAPAIPDKIILKYFGLAETVQILTGKSSTTPEGIELIKQIKKYCTELFTQENNLHFSMYYI